MASPSNQSASSPTSAQPLIGWGWRSFLFGPPFRSGDFILNVALLALVAILDLFLLGKYGNPAFNLVLFNGPWILGSIANLVMTRSRFEEMYLAGGISEIQPESALELALKTSAVSLQRATFIAFLCAGGFSAFFWRLHLSGH